MAMWNPWRGCHRNSVGCKYCYIHKGDARRKVDTNIITKSKRFATPLEKNKSGEYKMASGQTVFLCFSSDFLIEEADAWREACWEIIRKRSDLQFVFLTKRIHRFMSCIPSDWKEGYDHVTVGCTIENQEMANERLEIFESLPIKHKNIICQPLLEKIDIEKYLKNIDLVVVGGESDYNARPLEYDWVLAIREQCIRQNTKFQFRQCGTHFIKDGKKYKLPTKLLCSQARKAGIDT